MQFRTSMAILMFCAGATFTMVDIGTDISLAHEYWNNSGIVRRWWSEYETSNGLHSYANFVFAIPTTVWILLGGLIQFLLVAYFLCRGDARLTWLPKSVRILLLFCSPILLGPVVVNIYGAVFVIRTNDDIRIQNVIPRLAIDSVFPKIWRNLYAISGVELP